MSRNTEIVATDVARLANVVRLDLSVGPITRTLTYHVRKSLVVLRACLNVVRNGWRRNPVLCISSEGQLGLVYTLAAMIAARLSGHDIVMQHHSFAPIDGPSNLMRWVVWVGGMRTHHVFLCSVMRRRFLETYPLVRHYLTSSNARYTPPQPIRRDPASPSIKVGLLSNLNREKGLYQFLDLIETCVKRNLPVIGVLAGPPQSEAEQHAIQVAQEKLGDRLAYLHSLYGADQAKFYGAIDVFVFPTTYVHEAQPNVIFEAMAYGAAVISYSRACLSEDLTAECGMIIPQDQDFVGPAIRQLERWCADRGELAKAQSASAARLAMLHRAANTQYDQLLRQIAGVGSCAD